MSIPTVHLDGLSPERFGEFVEYVKPTPEELHWLEIHWETDLWEARQKAAAAGKPIFLWAMNGDPLGCV